MKRGELKPNPERVREFQERGRRSSAESFERSAVRAADKEPKRRKSSLKPSQPDRDWSDARAKVEYERVCRNCGYDDEFCIEAAHVIGRVHDEPVLYCRGCKSRKIAFNLCMDCFAAGRDPDRVVESKTLYVKPDSVIPLCRTIFSNAIWGGCHPRYDAHELDILPLLTEAERRQALEDCDHDAIAYLNRVTGDRYIPERKAA